MGNMLYATLDTGKAELSRSGPFSSEIGLLEHKKIVRKYNLIDVLTTYTIKDIIYELINTEGDVHNRALDQDEKRISTMTQTYLNEDFLRPGQMRVEAVLKDNYQNLRLEEKIGSRIHEISRKVLAMDAKGMLVPAVRIDLVVSMFCMDA